MPYQAVTRALKAAADETRLRLLVLLARGEATVGELQAVLDQSQPRVSRHLRLLTDAGLVARFREGQWVYYALAADAWARDLVGAATGAIPADDPGLRADLSALDRVKAQRHRDAHQRSAGVPRLLPSGVGGGPDSRAQAEALEELLGDARVGDALVVGCGGVLARWLAPRVASLVAVDASRAARVLARARIHDWGLPNCTVRAADPAALPFAAGAFDLVVLDGILSRGDQAARSLREAARVLRPDGRLLVQDRIHPVARRLGEAPAGLADNQVTAWLAAAGFRVAQRRWLPGRALENAVFAATPAYREPRTGTDD
jgi:DNA-binding transcriptional ArsR family regulator